MEKLSKEIIEAAAMNGISRATVYRRVKDKGWKIEDAIAIPPDNRRNSLKRQSSILYRETRGKLRSFKLPIENEEEWQQLVDKSGLTELDFATEIILKYLLTIK